MYAPEKEALVWKIKNFPGGREFLLRCKFGLPSVAAEDEAHGRLPPIKVKFEVRGAGRRVGVGAGAACGKTGWYLHGPAGALLSSAHLGLPCVHAPPHCCPLRPLRPQIPYYSVRQVHVCTSGHAGSCLCAHGAVCALRSSPPVLPLARPPAPACSGIQVRYLKVIERSGYQALPW